MSSEAAPWQRALAHVQDTVSGPPLPEDLQVTIHFHPDRPVGEVLLLEHLIADGLYRSQFETGTSNGGLTAHPGGDRWHWEHRIFGGAYDGESAIHRPKYGSLNYQRRPSGGSVRFGSSHLVLAAHALERTTFCFPDSSTNPSHFGTNEHMPLIDTAESTTGLDVLDDHIEAHIHGPLLLIRDIEALVLDPSFKDTDIEEAASKLPFPHRWHHGFRVHVDVLEQHPAFRGQHVVQTARDIAEEGWLDPRIIGAAARTQTHPAQTIKQVWHYTARFGHRWDRICN